jgi:hypothetical protein
MFTGTGTGMWLSLPEATPGEFFAVPLACESANAKPPHRDRMLVAAAATTTPLLRVCRNLVVFLLEEVGKGRPRNVERLSKAGPETATEAGV